MLAQAVRDMQRSQGAQPTVKELLHEAVSTEAENHQSVRCCQCNPNAFAVEHLPPPPLPAHLPPGAVSPFLVSVVVPTTAERHWAHPNLYRNFIQQTWPQKELVVLDTGEVPSPFFTNLNDSRVRYTFVGLHQPNAGQLLRVLGDFVEAAARQPPGQADASQLRRSAAEQGPMLDPTLRTKTRWAEVWEASAAAIEHAADRKAWFELEDERVVDSPVYLETVSRVITLGTKRNWLASQARGAVLANFDDDDVYLPSYLERMVSTLCAHRADLIKLSSFYHVQLASRSLYHCDVDTDTMVAMASGHDSASHGSRWGFGFTYVYTAELAAAAPYDPVNFGEDYKVVLTAASLGLRCLCFSTARGDGLALHVTHHANSSVLNYGKHIVTVRSVADSAAFDEEFAEPCVQLIHMEGREVLAGMMSHMKDYTYGGAYGCPRNRSGVAGAGALFAAEESDAEDVWMHRSRLTMARRWGDREESSVARILRGAGA